MAGQGNMYALLEADADSDFESAATTVTVEEPAEMRKGNRRTTPSQNLSKLQPPFNQGSETGRDKRRNGNDSKKYNGQQNLRISFRPDNGYRPDERPGYSSKQHEGQRNNSSVRSQHGPDDRPAYIPKQHEGRRNNSQKREHRPDGRPVYNSKQHEGQRKKQEQRPADSSRQDDLKKEAEANEGCRPDEMPADGSKQGEGKSDVLKKEGVSDDGEEWQVIRRRNHRRFGSLGSEEGGERNRERQRKGERRSTGNVGEGNGERRRRRRREFSVGSERNGERRDGNVGRGERNRGRERNGDARRGFQGDTNGTKVEGGNDEGFHNGNGMTPLEEQKDIAGSNISDVTIVDSKDPESKNSKVSESKNSKEPEFRKWQRDQRMTLKDYEKQLEEKRKILECMKKQEQRVVTLDKEFESMQVVEKKKEEEETIFIKLSSESDRPKKKVTTGKNGYNAPKPLMANFKVAGTNYSEKLVRRYERNGDRNGGYSKFNREGEENGNDNGSYPRRKEHKEVNQNGSEGGHDRNCGIGDLKKEEEKPASNEDQFPSLYLGTMKTIRLSA